jgi:sterol-4alpha-carboxylate 3-dehydrogenase (decarboxylating)
MELSNILITGGCGFVGSAIARAIAEKYPRCAITVIDIAPPGSVHKIPPQAEFVKVDVTSVVEVEKAIQRARPTTVIHTAGIVPVLAERFGRRMQSAVWKLNVDGTRIILEVSKRLGVKAFVFTSSCCVTVDDMRLSYRNIDEDWPTSQTSLIYGESKVGMTSLLNFGGARNFVYYQADEFVNIVGSCRKTGARGVLCRNGYLFSPTFSAHRAR